MTRTIFLPLCFLLLPLGAGCEIYGEFAEVSFATNLEAAGIKKLVVEAEGGGVDVRCVQGAETFEIQGVKFARGKSKEEAREYAERIDVDVSRDEAKPGLLKVRARLPDRQRARTAGVRLDISSPPHLAFTLRTGNADAGLTGARGEVDIQTGGGQVKVADVQGNLRLETRSGTISVRDARGMAALQSSSGLISVENLQGRTFRAVTKNGHIRARQTTGNVTLRSTNGSIDLRAKSLPDNPEISTETRRGRVVVEVPPSVNARLWMRTRDGNVTAEFPDVSVKELRRSKTHLAATINKGTGRIEILSRNGAVIFRVREPRE